MSKKKNLCLHLCLFIIGGVGYVLIELLWRRRSHASMFFVGGLCFELMGAIHTRLVRWTLPLRCGLCALAVSAVELVSGCILNRWLRLGVWDYSKMRFHLLGQVRGKLCGSLGLTRIIALGRGFDFLQERKIKQVPMGPGPVRTWNIFYLFLFLKIMFHHSLKFLLP